MEVEALKTTNNLFLSHAKYIKEVLEKTKMHKANAVSTPLVSLAKFILEDGSKPFNATQYKKVASNLQYLSLTWLDIAFAVNKHSRYIHQSFELHWQCIKSSLSFHTFFDVDWGGNKNDFTFTTAYLFFLGAIRYPGLLKSKNMCLVSLQKPNNELWLILSQSGVG